MSSDFCVERQAFQVLTARESVPTVQKQRRRKVGWGRESGGEKRESKR